MNFVNSGNSVNSPNCRHVSSYDCDVLIMKIDDENDVKIITHFPNTKYLLVIRVVARRIDDEKVSKMSFAQFFYCKALPW